VPQVLYRIGYSGRHPAKQRHAAIDSRLPAPVGARTFQLQRPDDVEAGPEADGRSGEQMSEFVESEHNENNRQQREQQQHDVEGAELEPR
jgi:hypothetical protein